MKIEAKALLTEHANETLTVAFAPGPPKPRPPLQVWPHAAIVRRSIDGDDADLTRRAPSLAGFEAAVAASYDWPVPMRSSSDPSRYGGGGIGSSGFGKPPAALQAREEYSLAEREYARIARALPPRRVASGHVFDGAAQMRIRMMCHGPGEVVRQVIRGGPERRVKGMGLVPASPEVRVPTREKRDATHVSELVLKPAGIVATPHEVGLICREVSRRVESAFVAHGWVRARRVKVSEAAAAEEAVGEMANVGGCDLVGWKAIAPLVGDKSAETCRGYAAREVDPLPVYDGLGGEVLAKSAEVLAWVARQVQPRARRSA